MYESPRPVDELADRLGIDALASTTSAGSPAAKNSGVALAASLMGNPEVLFLDEPSAGLDPQSRLMVFELIASCGTRAWASS